MNFFFLFIAVLLYMTLSGCKVLTVAHYKGPVSNHFDGKKFMQPGGNEMGDFKDLLSHRISNKNAKWTKIKEAIPCQEPILEKISFGIRYRHIGHATVLIQHQELNILTDPVFSNRASPYLTVGPKRFRPPAITIDELPKIDVIIISHDHYDHLDIRSLKRITQKHQSTILVGLGLKAYLSRFGIKNVIEMDWQDTTKVGEIIFTFLPAKHWSNRGLSPYKTLWGSYMLSSNSHTIYFGGDSGFDNHYQVLATQYPNIDLAFLPIGAYVPRSFMKYVHMDPAEAIMAHIILNPKLSVGIHWGTFQLTGEGMFDPADLLEQLTKEKGIVNFIVDRNHTVYGSL